MARKKFKGISAITEMKTIRQTVTFNATPHEVYEVLMDSKKHSAFTEAEAKISKKVGGKFSAYDSYIEGKNMQLMPGKKIVQEWRGSDWPEKHFSIATFELKQIKSGTKLIFTQTRVPDMQYKGISKGWKEHYWAKMKKMFGKT